jgi:hypothetical protein
MLKIVAAVILAAVPTIVARTNVVTFDARSMHVSARASGSCWTASIASHRTDALRCIVGNAIHDPCFALSARSVACPASGDTRSGLLISLTKPLPKNAGTANPWRMVLVSGTVCGIGTGTILPGYPFYCTGGLVCSVPSAIAPGRPVFVRCAAVQNGKLASAGTYLVRTLFE